MQTWTPPVQWLTRKTSGKGPEWISPYGLLNNSFPRKINKGAPVDGHQKQDCNSPGFFLESA